MQKRCILLCPYDPSCPSVFMATALAFIFAFYIEGGAFKFLANYYLKRDMLDDAYKLAMKCTQLADVMEVSDINLQFYVICDNFRYFVCSSRYTNPFDQPFCWTTSSSQDGKALIKEISNRRVTLEGGRGTVTVMEDQPSFVSIRVNQVHSAAMYSSTMQLCEFSCVYLKSCWIFFWSILMFHISETEILIVHELICFMFL